MPIEPSDDVFHNGKGADEFFDEVSGDTSSLSASEECSEGSSDANFSNITFSLPGNDFRIYFPGNSDLLNKITQVSISNEVTEIGDCIFQNCSLLTNIKIPNSVTVIGTRAFEKCYSLKNISIPNSVKEIKKYAFYDCRSLANINIPNSVKKIGDNVFMGCFSLLSVKIPSDI